MYTKNEIESAEKRVISLLECLATTKMKYVKTIIDIEPHLSYVKNALTEAGYKYEIEYSTITIEV